MNCVLLFLALVVSAYCAFQTDFTFASYGADFTSTTQQWWNTTFLYRIQTTSQSCNTTYVSQVFDFTTILNTLGSTSDDVDRNSIRVIEVDGSGNYITELPSQSRRYFPALVAGGTPTNASVAVTWKLSASGNTTRKYFIYFNSLNTGATVAPAEYVSFHRTNQ